MTLPQTPDLIHATCIAIDDIGVLLRGVSGVGKSDLALRLIDRGAMLVGDDYVQAAGIDGALCVTVPDRIAGLIEIRGVGIESMPYRPTATIGLVIDLTTDPDGEDRLPDSHHTVIAGIAIPIYRLNPLPASASIKVERLVSRLKERS